MNILTLNYEYFPIGGGGAVVSHDIGNLLCERGHNVTVVTMHYKGLPRYECENGVNIYRIPCLRSKANVCYPWEQLSYCLSAMLFLRKHLKMHTYDIVHTHFIIPTGLIALWLKRKKRINYILTAHGSDVIGHNKKRFKFLYKILKNKWFVILKNANKITCPSNYLVNEIQEQYPLANCTNIANGLDLNKYKTLEKKRSILVLGRLQESKGIQDIIVAFSKINFEGWCLHIAGDGPYRNKLQRLAENLGISKKIFFLGHVEGEQRLKLLGEASIFVSASKFESFGLSVLEAMACNSYIIASNIPPFRELLEQKHLFSSIKELEQKLEQAMREENNRKFSYLLEKYDWKNIICQFEAVLKEEMDR